MGMSDPTTYIGARVETALKRRLAEAAKRAHRSLSAELRLAILDRLTAAKVAKTAE